MRVFKILVVASLFVAFSPVGTGALLGCSARPKAEASDGTAAESGLTLQAPPKEVDACSSARFVGQSIAGSCPAPGATPVAAQARWVGAPLFGGGAVPGLASFCTYDWLPTGAQPGLPEKYLAYLPKESGRPADQWLQRDCDIAAPLAPSGDPTGSVRRDLHRSLMEQVGGVIPPKQHASVRVAVIDTSPDHEGPSLRLGTSGHGYAMGRLIENVACPRDDGGALLGGDCGLAETTYLGLPRASVGGPIMLNGGRFGSLTDVAQAIDNAVASYKKSVPFTQERLIVNLSLGWEPSWATVSTPYGVVNRDAMTSVREAIRRAVCYGAIVVAAAGNDSGSSTPASGAMYPAAWESLPAPTPLECAKFEGTSAYAFSLPGPILTGGYQPLLYAVSGVDAVDRDIAVTRLLSKTRIVAPAARAAGRTVVGESEAPDDETDRTLFQAEGTDVLTGTSVAAALTSGTAALVWSQRPDLSAAQVMDRIYGASVPLNQPANVYLPSRDTPTAAPDARRLDACSALAAACEGGVYCDAKIVTCSPRPASVAAPPALAVATMADIDAEEAAAPLVSITFPAFSTALQSPDSICQDYWLPLNAGAARRCPGRELYQMSSEPWCGSQPGYPECPSCRYSMAARTLATKAIAGPRAGGARVTDTAFPADAVSLYVAIDPAFAATLISPTLRITYNWGPTTVEADLSSASIGGPVRIVASGLPYPTYVERAEIAAWSITADGRGKTSVMIPLGVQ